MAFTIVDLPYEIFDLVLDSLLAVGFNNARYCINDILQMQVTCKGLRQSSTERLYESVYFNCQETANLFIKSIANSRAHGKLVKKIILGEELTKAVGISKEEEEQTQSLLLVLYKYCPNVTEIEGLHDNKTLMWNSLVKAASNLKYLQVVPAPSHYGDEAKLYRDTVLSYSNTLTKVEVFDETLVPSEMRKIQLIGYTSPTPPPTPYLQNYNIVSSRLKEFKNLKSLKLIRRIYDNNKNMLMEFDAMINRCPKLVEFKFIRHCISSAEREYMAIDDSDTNTDTLKNQHIQARPDIKTFYGDGKVIGNDVSMEYLMQKFSKLNNLTILLKHNNSLRGDDPVEFSGATMAKFFGYISNIPFVFVEIMLVDGSIIDMWTNMMSNMMQIKKKPTLGFRNRIVLDYNGTHQYLLKRVVFTKKSSSTVSAKEEDLTTTLCLPPFVSSSSYKDHKQLIENIGPMLQKLTITQMENMQYSVERRGQSDALCGGGNWLDHVFTNCSSLTDLTIIQPGYIQFQKSSKVVLNGSLKTLVIEDLQTVALDECNYGDRSTTDKVFSEMSLRLPQLKNLHLHNVYGQYYEKFTTIDMPHTSFNKFVWDRTSSTTVRESMQQEEDWKVYIQITKSGSGEEKFYTASQFQINHSTKEAHEDAISTNSGLYYISICCKSIEYLQIKIKDESNKNYLFNLAYNI